VFQLVVQVLILDDRSGDELGEEGDEGAEGDDVFLGMCVSDDATASRAPLSFPLA